MSVSVSLRPEADEDLTNACAWYDRQKPGLNWAFLAEVAAGLSRISDFPEMYGVIWQDVRAFRIRRFPYIVYYRIVGGAIEVQAILHASRDSAVWQSRT